MEKVADHYQKLHSLLEQYHLTDPQLEILQNHGSLVVRVIADRRSYALRVCEPATPRARVQQEINWLLALHRDTGLNIPAPLANAQGEYITPWSASESEPVQQCVLFSWVEGESVRQHMSLETARAIGSMVGRLHRHAQTYTQAGVESFVGPRYDLDWLIGPTSWWGSGLARQHLGNATYQRFVPAIEIAAEVMQRLDEGAEHFGIIHHDLHVGNIMVDGDRYGVIDFGDCSLGHYLHDLAIVEQDFRDADPGYLAAFHEQYCRERGITTFSLHDLEALMISSDIVFLEWILSTDNLEAREYCLPWVPGRIERIVASEERARQLM